MKKKLSILLIVVILAFFTFALKIHAQDIDIDYWKPSTDTGSNTELSRIGGNILGVIQVVGTVISIVILIILGIKYMCGSVEERVQYRKSMVPYIVGAVLVFATTNVVAFIYDVVTGIDEKHEHAWDAGKVTTKATCVVKEVITYTCSGCGTTKTQENNVDLNNHTNWTAWDHIFVSCSAEDKTKKRTCKACGKEEIEVASIIHKDVTERQYQSNGSGSGTHRWSEKYKCCNEIIDSGEGNCSFNSKGVCIWCGGYKNKTTTTAPKPQVK